MGFWDLKLIRELRIKLGLTQQQLAKLSGVSQSLIAKIESGRVNPSFEAVKKIFTALEKIRVERNMDIKARDIYTNNILYVSKNDPIYKAVEIMRKHDVSQLPVFDGDKLVGSISESTITRKLDQIDPHKTRVYEIMDECFPIIPEETNLTLVKEILMEYQAVLTQRNGKITGIITKADILKILEKTS